MKTLRSLLVTLAITLLLSAKAFGSEGERSTLLSMAENSVKLQLSGVLRPADISGYSGEITVVFSSTAQNQFKIVNISGTDRALLKKYKSRLAQKHIEVPNALVGHVYSITIRFVEIPNSNETL